MQWFKVITKTHFKTLRIFILSILLLLLTFSTNFLITAETRYLIPGGETIGIRIETGIYVVGKFQVETKDGKVSPWRKSDLQTGDRIIQIDGKKVINNRALLEYLQTTKDEIVVLTVERGNLIFNTQIEVAVSKTNEKTLGIYVKDRLLGVGTLTFIDPSTKRFAALGHGVYDSTTSLGNTSGNILTSSVESIKKGTPGTPGEKRATMKSEVLGDIASNRATGLYGIVKNQALLTKKTIPVASQQEVKRGKAYFMTVVTGGKIEMFNLEIIETNYQETSSVKGLKVKITDINLIDKTGGIIQGMSGSPIIQDGKIIGAISHVTVENPLIGYGIYIEWMLQDCTNFDIN